MTKNEPDEYVAPPRPPEQIPNAGVGTPQLDLLDAIAAAAERFRREYRESVGGPIRSGHEHIWRTSSSDPNRAHCYCGTSRVLE
jgi:hypothetical protein